MHDLRDVTFIIPVYIDTPERLRNLQLCLRHLTRLFDTNILIGEQRSGAMGDLTRHLSDFDGRFEYSMCVEDGDNFYRTRLLNRLMAQVQTPLACNLDLDAVFAFRQYVLAAQMLRWNVADFVLPHRENVVHIPAHCADLACEKLAQTPFEPDDLWPLCEYIWRGNSVGGATFANTETYRACGGENENFVGWGWEDHERISRFEKLGFRVRRTPDSFYHLSHPRGATSSHQHEQFENNERELARIDAMTREELQGEVASWRWAR